MALAKSQELLPHGCWELGAESSELWDSATVDFGLNPASDEIDLQKLFFLNAAHTHTQCRGVDLKIKIK